MWFYNFLILSSYESWFSVYVFTLLPLYTAWRIFGKHPVFETLGNSCNVASAACVLPIVFTNIMAEHPPHGVGYISYMEHQMDVFYFYDALNMYYMWLPCLYWLFFIRPCRKSWTLSLVICVVCNPFFDLDQFVVWVFHLTGRYYDHKLVVSEVIIKAYLSMLFLFWGITAGVFGLYIAKKTEPKTPF